MGTEDRSDPMVDGRVYFGTSGDGRLCALDVATGKTVWTRHAGGPVRLAPSFSDGRVYFGADDGIRRKGVT